MVCLLLPHRRCMHCLPLNFARFFYSASSTLLLLCQRRSQLRFLSHSRVCRACFTYANSQVSPPPLPHSLSHYALSPCSPHLTLTLCMCVCVCCSPTRNKAANCYFVRLRRRRCCRRRRRLCL